jgi:hypothetical protein
VNEDKKYFFQFVGSVSTSNGRRQYAMVWNREKQSCPGAALSLGLIRVSTKHGISLKASSDFIQLIRVSTKHGISLKASSDFIQIILIFKAHGNSPTKVRRDEFVKRRVAFATTV